MILVLRDGATILQASIDLGIEAGRHDDHDVLVRWRLYQP
jgi:hypothetical protein